jgi:hypothetical protein
MRAPTATFSCAVAYAPHVSDHLRRGGFQVAYRDSAAPAVFDYVVSDGARRAALIAVKHPEKEELTLMLAPLRPRWGLRGLFGQKAFAFSVVTWLLNASWGDPGSGLQDAGVAAPLRPPPLALIAGAARALPIPDDRKGGPGEPPDPARASGPRPGGRVPRR